jgi:hypothetical protein
MVYMAFPGAFQGHSSEPNAADAATTALQTKLMSAKERGTRIELASGDIAIDAEVKIGNVSGGVIEGKGASELLDYQHPLSAASTRLIASGKDRVDMTLLTADGAETVIRDLSLYGYTRNEHNSGAERAKCGLLITKTAEGLGTGGLTLDNVFVVGFKTGIQAAVGVIENNCERSSFRRVRFHNNDAGFVVKSQQSMGFGVTDCEWWNNLDCIRVEGGGKIVVSNAFVSHPMDAKEQRAFLRIAPRDQELSIGPNNGFYHVTGLYADQAAPNLRLVAMRPVDDKGIRTPFYCSTTFEGFHISNETYTEPAIEVAGISSTTLRDGYGVQKKWVTWDNDPDGPFKWTSRVLIENCQVFDCEDGREVLDLASARGWCRVIVKDCYDQFNEPIKDFEGLVLGKRK